jgi:hypothetical protein
MSLGAAPPLEATAALLLGGGADLPFLGHLRCSVGTAGARLWLTGRLAVQAHPVEAWAAARAVEGAVIAAVEAVPPRRAGDRFALLRAAWAAILALEPAALGPAGGADLSALVVAADPLGQGLSAAGLGALLAGEDPGLQPLVPADHPLLGPAGRPADVPHVLHLKQLPPLLLAVPWGHPGPLPEPGRARAAAGARP